MNQDIIVYHSPLQKELAETSSEMYMDFGVWLWTWVPLFIKWYLIVALLVAIVYEIVTTIKQKRFNGIKDGILTGLAWPLLVWYLVAPLFGAIMNGKSPKWNKWM